MSNHVRAFLGAMQPLLQSQGRELVLSSHGRPVLTIGEDGCREVGPDFRDKPKLMFNTLLAVIADLAAQRALEAETELARLKNRMH